MNRYFNFCKLLLLFSLVIIAFSVSFITYDVIHIGHTDCRYQLKTEIQKNCTGLDVGKAD